MKESVAVVSDLHVHTFPEHSVLVDGVPSRLLDVVSVLDDVHVWCEDNNCETVFFCGDLLHVPGVLKTLAWNLVVSKLSAFKAAGISVVAIPGNHDQVGRDGLVDAIEALDCVGLVHSLHTAGKRWGEWSRGGLRVVGFPYCDDRDMLLRWVEAAGEADVALFHHGFKGAKVGTYLEYVVKEPIRARELRGKYPRVFSGHYHARQPIKGLDHAEYVGSPLEFTRSDVVEGEKGFLKWTPGKAGGKVELVPLTRPRFVKISPDELLDLGDCKHVRGNFVDVTYVDYEGGPSQIEKDLREAGARGVRIEKFVPEQGEKTVKVLPAARGLAEEWERHVHSRKAQIRESGLSSRKILKEGLRLLSEAEAEVEPGEVKS